ncbi:MAG TPA: hypothetical protein VFG54_12160 [Prolixibacteraceae bacterium]|nr:hypothetical protein [Prolixibacteraceae bacterium]
MGKLTDDILKWTLDVNGDPARKELTEVSNTTNKLERDNRALATEMAKLEAHGKKGSEEWKKYEAQIKANNVTIGANKKKMEELRKEVGLNNLSATELRKEMKSLKSQMDKMDPETKGWNDMNVQFSAMKSRLSDISGGAATASGFFGKLNTSINAIPGPVGDVIQGIGGMGKALWTLVANPIGATIALIVGGLTLLYKAFTSTDDGAVAMEGTLKAISNTMDILLDRAMSYYKMLWSLVTFDWEGVKSNAKDAFGGLVSSIKDATNAGWDYAHSMDDIADREVAASNRMTQLRVDIEKLKNISKDQTKTSKERMAAAQQAMDKEIELNKIETGFMTERNNAETMNLASKIQNSKLTMAQKEEQLKQWLKVDDLELASMMEKDAAFAEFVNKNADEFQALQKAKSDELMKEAELAQETRKLQSQLSGFKKELINEEVEARKNASEKAIATLDAANNEHMSKLAVRYEKEGWTDARFKSEQLAAEQAYLALKKSLLEKYGQSTVEVESQINQKRIEAQKDLNAVLADGDKELMQSLEDSSKIDLKAIDATIEAADKTIQTLEDSAEKEKEILAQRQEAYMQFAQMIGQSFGDLMNDSEATFADYLKNVLLMSLEALHQFFIIEKAKTLIKGAGTGFIGLAKAVAQIAAMELIYQGVKGVLTKKGKQSGGYADSDPSDATPVGVYHANEFIASAPAVRNPTVKPVLDIIDMAQKSGSIKSLNLRAILNTGRQTGGYSSPGNAPAASSPVIVPAGGMDPGIANLIADAIYNRLSDWNPSISIEEYERKRKNWDKITSSGLK